MRINIEDGILEGIRDLRFAANGQIRPAVGSHLLLNSFLPGSDQSGETIRLNVATSVGTASDYIGFQVKPRQGATTTKNIIGGEISAQISDAFGAATLIGLHVDTYLRGTSAGAISGDVRGLQVELVTDDAGVRAIAGNVYGIRMRMAFSAAVTGAIAAIRIEKAEAQTGSVQWEYVLDLTDVNGLIWDDDFGTEPADAAGGFKVRINGNDRWVQTYSTAPS